MKRAIRLGCRTSVLTLAALLVTASASAGVTAPNCKPVPEIDPGSAVAAVTLLTGGVLVLRDRFGRKA